MVQIKDFIASLQLEIISAEPEKLMLLASEKGITLREIYSAGDLKTVVTVSRKDWIKLERLLQQRGETFKILHKSGLYWTLINLRKRPVLIAAFMIYLMLIFYLPSRVLFIKVEGNDRIAETQILDAAQSCGLSFGSSRRQLRSEKIKNGLLEMLPDLQWAGVNTKGCVATISVLEKFADGEPKLTNGINGIFSSCDGVVRSVTVQKGSALCAVGDAVREGQLLVSGYTDYGLVVKAESAEGEIYADTKRSFEVLAPVNYAYRAGEGEKTLKFSLLFGKNLINFFDSSRISGATCVKMYKEYYVTLPGGFRLPAALIVSHVVSYPDTLEKETDTGIWLEKYARDYTREQMIAGQICTESFVRDFTEDACRLQASFSCYEMIGRVRIEEITERYGKTD